MDKTLKKHKNQGLSLVELVLGMAILVFVFGSTLVVMLSVSRHSTHVTMVSRAEHELHTVAELTRYVAASPMVFETMGGTDTLRGQQFKNIEITRRIYPIDPGTRSRKIELIASWTEATEPHTRALTFEIQRIRAKLTDAIVRVRVRNRLNPTEGVNGVEARAAGQDTPSIVCVTGDPNPGECFLSGVLHSSGTRVTLNGASGGGRFFFADSGPPPDDPPYLNASWETEATAPPTRPGQVVDLDVNMYPPGRITGRVSDFVRPAEGVENAGMYLFAKDGTEGPVVPFTPAGDDAQQFTDNLGSFTFTAIPPGGYWLAMMGDEDRGEKMYPALAVVDLGGSGRGEVNDPSLKDHWQIRVESASTTIRNFTVPQKGAFRGTVHAVEGTGPGFDLRYRNTPVSEGVVLRFRHTPNWVYRDDWFFFELWNTMAWARFWPGTQEYWYGTDNDGVVNTDYISPIIVHDAPWDLSDPNNKHPQKNSVIPKPALDIKEVTPILVTADAFLPNRELVNPKFLLCGPFEIEKRLPPGTPDWVFAMPMETDGLTNPNNINRRFLYLSWEALGNVTGDINGSLETGTVSTYWDGGPHNGGGVNYDGFNQTASLDPYYSRPATGGGSYDLRNTAGRRALPPNIQGGRTVVIFEATPAPQNENKGFGGAVVGYEKWDNGGIIDERVVPPPQVDVNPFPVERYVGPSGGAPDQTDNVNVDVNNGTFIWPNLPSQYTNRVWGSTEVAVRPGRDETADIEVTGLDPEWSAYYIKPGPNLWQSGWWYDTTRMIPEPPANGVSFTCNGCPVGGGQYQGTQSIAVVRWGTVRVFGRITNESSEPFPGVSVTVSGSWGNTETLVTDANGRFNFPTIYYVMIRGPNFRFEVRAGGEYDDVFRNEDQGYVGLTELEIDFELVPRGGGGSTTGGGNI